MEEINNNVSSNRPLFSIVLFYFAGGLIAAGCIIVTMISLAKLHYNSNYIATVDVPLSSAVQEATTSLSEANQTVSSLMSADSSTPSDDIIRNQGKLRNNIAKVERLLNAIIWGSDSEAFSKSAGGLNRLEWQRSGYDKKLHIEKGSQLQTRLASKASIEFSGFAQHANKATLAHLQSLSYKEANDLSAASAAANIAQVEVLKLNSFEDETASGLKQLSDTINPDVVVRNAFINKLWDVNKKTLPLLGILAIIGSIVIGVAFALSQIIRPLIAMQKTFAFISAGRIKDALQIKDSGPFAAVANSFNSMVGKLQKDRATLTEELETKKSIIQKQTENYDKTKQAMMNLLQDARVLEEELKQEKTNVEEKVVERTKELRNEQARLAASVNSLSAGFIMTNDKQEVLLVNPVAEHILMSDKAADNKQKTLSFKQIATFFGSDLDFGDNITRCLKSKNTIEVPELLYNGRFLHLYFTPIIDLSAAAIGAVVLIQDVTEEKIMARSKDEFFSIASHELRTPLTAIRGNTSMMQQYYAEALKDPSLKEMVDDIHNSSLRLIAIVNDFLDASRLEQGKMEFKKEKIRLDKIIEAVIYEMGSLSKEKKIYLKADLTLDQLPDVYGDPDKVKQIVYNLVGNAMKFTEEGGITISVEANDKFIKVKVADTGRGIPLDKQNMLFRKFQQAGESLLTRDTTRGTGLGLYISKLLAENMGGGVNLDESKEGKGSVFSFTLPLTPPDSKDNEEAAEITKKVKKVELTGQPQ